MRHYLESTKLEKIKLFLTQNKKKKLKKGAKTSKNNNLMLAGIICLACSPCSTNNSCTMQRKWKNIHSKRNSHSETH